MTMSLLLQHEVTLARFKKAEALPTLGKKLSDVEAQENIALLLYNRIYKIIVAQINAQQIPMVEVTDSKTLQWVRNVRKGTGSEETCYNSIYIKILEMFLDEGFFLEVHDFVAGNSSCFPDKPDTITFYISVKG